MFPELLKAGHRGYTTGFFFKETDRDNVSLDSPQATQSHDFVARVLGFDEQKGIFVEQRNRFLAGDELEILSPGPNFNRILTVGEMTDEDGNSVSDAKFVQQKLYLKSDVVLSEGDILRKKK